MTFTLKTLTGNISGILQRGRHAKIHVVLAAQNPTVQNMKVDLGNITARIAFQCAKKNFSEMILGEGGAENLSGRGDMYFKAPQYGGLLRMQGIFISPQELAQIVRSICLQWVKTSNMAQFTINAREGALLPTPTGHVDERLKKLRVAKASADTMLFSKIALWTLGRDNISCNMLLDNFNIGWRRANGFLECLNEYGVVDALDAKLPRKVLPQSVEDVPKKIIEILIGAGYSLEDVADAIKNKTV